MTTLNKVTIDKLAKKNEVLLRKISTIATKIQKLRDEQSDLDIELKANSLEINKLNNN